MVAADGSETTRSTALAAAGNAGRVGMRRVFYIPGYDPFPPRRYRELYRREGALQAAISGHEITLAAGGPEGGYGWSVTARIEGAEVRTEVEVLTWSDLVKASMGQGVLATYGQLARTAWIYATSGALWPLLRLRKGPLLATLYPVVILLVQLGLALGLGLAAARLAAGLVPAPWNWGGLLLALPVLAAFRAADGRIYAWYLMHDFAHAARHRGAYGPELEARLAAFAARIRAALDAPLDEVLVVGHSSGAHLAVSVLADLTRAGLPARRTALSLLTLGQAVPMVSFLPRAQRLRGDLRLMAAQTAIPWVDVTAPGDGCSFALCDPVAVSGVAPEPRHWPLVLSAAYSRTLSPERQQALRRRFFRLHFQYLCAFDRPGAYDYFRITAGPLTLARRFAGRRPSASRIERPVSPHTSVAA